MIYYKTCTHCLIKKEIICFSIKRANKDGLKNSCKDCDKAYKVRNAEAISLREAQFRKENASELRLKQSIWRAKNPEARKVYYQKNKEKENELRKQWALNNIEQNREIKRNSQRKRRGLKKDLVENFSIRNEAFVKKLFNNQCFKCGCTYDLTIDHHKPLSKGFVLSLNNAVLLCRSCNSSKRDKDPKDFYSKEELIRLKKINPNLLD